MPMQRDPGGYPADWGDLALAIKEDADWKCQECGKQCRRPKEGFDTHQRTLTVHHADGNPHNCEPANLIAVCTVCHNRMDAPMRTRHRAETRRRKREQAGQLPIMCLGAAVCEGGDRHG